MMVILGFIVSVLGLVAYFVLKVALASATTALNAAQAGVRTTQRGVKVVGKRLFNGKSAKVADSAVDVSAKFANMSINALKMLVRMLKWLLALIKSVVGLFTGLSFTVGLVVALVLIVVIASTYTVVMMVVTKDLATGDSTMSDYSSMAAQASDEGTWGTSTGDWMHPLIPGDKNEGDSSCYQKSKGNPKDNYPADGSDIGLNSYEGHTGIDIGCAGGWGRPFYAVTDMIIDYVGTGRGYGNAIYATTSDKEYTLIFGHTCKIFVEAGQKVTKGTKLALIGSTGNSSGPHIHFEVRKDGSSLGEGAMDFLPDKVGENSSWKEKGF